MRTRGFEWLAAQGKTRGFSVDPDHVRVHDYRRHEITRTRKGRRGRGHSDNPLHATLDFDGVLTVTDPERFRRASPQGLGSSRTWGCGLMLIDTSTCACRVAA